MRRLRETRSVTPSVTPETRTVTPVTRLRDGSCHSRARPRVYVRACARVHMDHKVPRNRVTGVTVRVSGVTTHVTNVTIPIPHGEACE